MSPYSILLPEDDFGKIIQRSTIPQKNRPEVENNQNEGMMAILRALFGEDRHKNVSQATLSGHH